MFKMTKNIVEKPIICNLCVALKFNGYTRIQITDSLRHVPARYIQLLPNKLSAKTLIRAETLMDNFIPF